MEVNRGMATLLRALGYELYTVGGRVAQGEGKFTPFAHMMIILTLDRLQYLVDVGFGGSGLTSPLPIFNEKIIETPIKGAIPEEHRVTLAVIPNASLKDHKVWHFQHRKRPEEDWQTLYIFEKDFEFFEADYEVYVCLRFFSRQDEYGHLHGPGVAFCQCARMCERTLR